MTTLWARRQVPWASCGPPFLTALSPDVVTLPLPFPRACYFPHRHRSPPPPLLLIRRHQLPSDRRLCPPPFLLVSPPTSDRQCHRSHTTPLLLLTHYSFPAALASTPLLAFVSRLPCLK